MPLFDAKLFNGEVFQKYVDRIPNTKLNELVKSSAIRQRPELASSMSDQVGGNYVTTPLTGLISGSTPLNYDGQTDITSNSTKTFSHSRVVVGRANAWTERTSLTTLLVALTLWRMSLNRFPSIGTRLTRIHW